MHIQAITGGCAAQAATIQGVPDIVIARKAFLTTPAITETAGDIYGLRIGLDITCYAPKCSKD